tara:strand:+ start:2250 stop:2558 length:309 start_codon:yes stop_codon:yes gene_type:complete
MEAHSLMKTVSKTDRFNMSLEEVDGKQFIHCTVYNWSKTTKKQIAKEVNKLINKYEILYVLRNVENNERPSERFLEMYGFNYYKTIECLDGVDRPVWIKEST